MKINKPLIAKVGSMALAVGLLVGNFVKDILDKKEEEARISDLIDEKVKEALGIKEEKKETEEDSEDYEDYEDDDESDESEEDEET